MTDKGMSASPLEALKGGFRRACVRRLVGDEQGAISVLKDEIPKLVVSWAKTSNLDAGEKKVKLKEMFDDESRELTNWPPLLIYLQEDLKEEWRTWSQGNQESMPKSRESC